MAHNPCLPPPLPIVWNLTILCIHYLYIMLGNIYRLYIEPVAGLKLVLNTACYARHIVDAYKQTIQYKQNCIYGIVCTPLNTLLNLALIDTHTQVKKPHEKPLSRAL